MDEEKITPPENEVQTKPSETSDENNTNSAPPEPEPQKQNIPDFYADIEKEYTEKGTISKEFKEELLSKGATDKQLNSIVEGLEAKAKIAKLEGEQLLNDIYSSVGGKEQAETIKNWAAANLSKEEIEGINSIQSPAAMKFIYGALKSKMEQTEGKLPAYVEGGAKEAQSDYFKSQAQMIEAIKDPRYAKDPAYREEVSAKIRQARTQGINLSY